MIFEILMGVPEMENLWFNLSELADRNQLKGNDRKLFKQLIKSLNYLSQNPRHNSLNSHEIIPLSQRYGVKVWQSYLENKKPAAGRIYWVYGPGKNQITIIGLEPHPEDKKNKGYDKVVLSALPRQN
ncbi:MAG TPA: hypothetical protein PK605_07635 [Ignavibacteria bacterium]|nr:hypothetical protein [Bacteroidota bacterium]HRE10239.1 hypothetical protein [Ignavibacteria bacterium]HRF65382.1 hypothetical protein [Ignavibacteria bacterium]HRJ04259.1 hypothetical protein [Ignavibacteria bacterium]